MPKIEKKYLLLIAGLLWMIAGGMVTRIGFPLLRASHCVVSSVLGAVAVFLVFYLRIFSLLVYKHEKRIRNYRAEKLPFWYFFDPKSYILMAAMMGGGIALRTFGLLPAEFIAFFYPGLGIALFACGVRFSVRFLRYRSGFQLIRRHEKRLNGKNPR